MPIQIPNDLPAAEVLQQENIFVMKQTRAETQEIRPLEIVLLNLMPTKIDTIMHRTNSIDKLRLTKRFIAILL